MPKRLTPEAKDTLAKLRRGSTLCRQQSAEGVLWWLEPQGEAVAPETAAALVGDPRRVEAAGDGFMALGGPPQTYRALRRR